MAAPDGLKQRARSQPTTFLWSQSQSFEGSNETVNHLGYKIRSCSFPELRQVADIVSCSFYTQHSAALRKLFGIAELNRIQQNFPYDDERHHMLVAVDDTSVDSEVWGFCDVDNRPATRRIDPPRPYLSDVAIKPCYRRRGVARALVQQVEAIVLNDMKQTELYIRVDKDNMPANVMYAKLGFEPIEHQIFGVEDKTILMRKNLTPTEEDRRDKAVKKL